MLELIKSKIRSIKALFMVMPGSAIEAVMQSTDLTFQKDFSDFLINCNGVILYRSSPGQKAQIVEFVSKHQPSKVTLAIGDGVNDVAMI